MKAKNRNIQATKRRTTIEATKMINLIMLLLFSM
jgi:hypothetical protein